MTETFNTTRQVRDLPGQGWPPAGTECCVVRGDPGCEAYTGSVMEPRMFDACGVDAVREAEDTNAGSEGAWGRRPAKVRERA